MADQRKTAAQRRRRVLLNNDGSDAGDPRATNVADFLALRTSPFAGTPLDAILYCSHYSFNCCSHATSIGDPLEGPMLSDHGPDPLQTIVAFCHANGMEGWWSMRMNDVHDGINPGTDSRFKRDHPRWLLGRYGDHTDGMIGEPRWWSGVDYDHEPVRDRAFELIEDVCRQFDIDGIELDFFRHPIYFKPNRHGLPAEPGHLEAMTGFMRRVHAMVLDVGTDRGRPILVAVRVPEAVAICRHLGFDIERWLAEGLVDVLVPGGYFQLLPWRDSIDLGRAHGVPVYPCISASRLRERVSHALDREHLLWRAEALNIWEAGADGVYTFNFFDRGADIYHDLADPDRLRRLPRIYAPSSGSIDKFLGKQMRRRYGHLPLTVPAGASATAALQINESLRPEHPVKLTLRIRLSEAATRASIKATFNDVLMAGWEVSELNGKRLAPADTLELPGTWIACSPDAAILRRGRNEITVTCPQARTGAEPLVFQALQLEVNPQ